MRDVAERSARSDTSLRTRAAAVAVGVGLLTIAAPAMADVPGPHPGYVHALNDMRYAHWLLRVPAEWIVTDQERAATGFVDRAYADIRQAGFDDGKAINEPLPIDAGLSHRDRLSRAVVARESAHRYINGWDSDLYARGTLDAADGNLDAAIAHVRAASQPRGGAIATLHRSRGCADHRVPRHR